LPKLAHYYPRRANNPCIQGLATYRGGGEDDPQQDDDPNYLPKELVANLSCCEGFEGFAVDPDGARVAALACPSQAFDALLAHCRRVDDKIWESMMRFERSTGRAWTGGCVHWGYYHQVRIVMIHEDPLVAREVCEIFHSLSLRLDRKSHIGPYLLEKQVSDILLGMWGMSAYKYPPALSSLKPGEPVAFVFLNVRMDPCQSSDDDCSFTITVSRGPVVVREDPSS
jgi:hypothetical protein